MTLSAGTVQPGKRRGSQEGLHPELAPMVQAIKDAADAEERPAAPADEEAPRKAKIPKRVLRLLKPLALKATKHGANMSCAPACVSIPAGIRPWQAARPRFPSTNAPRVLRVHPALALRLVLTCKLQEVSLYGQCMQYPCRCEDGQIPEVLNLPCCVLLQGGGRGAGDLPAALREEGQHLGQHAACSGRPAEDDRAGWAGHHPGSCGRYIRLFLPACELHTAPSSSLASNATAAPITRQLRSSPTLSAMCRKLLCVPCY